MQWGVESDEASDQIYFKRFGITAMSGNKCHYFTCTDLSELRLPWDEDFQKGYEILGLEAAGKEWLNTLSLMDPNK
jgi:hypothetical protein